VDVINPDKLCVNLFKGFDFTGGQSFHFSHRKSDVAVITVLRYRADCDTPYVYKKKSLLLYPIQALARSPGARTRAILTANLVTCNYPPALGGMPIGFF